MTPGRRARHRFDRGRPRDGADGGGAASSFLSSTSRSRGRLTATPGKDAIQIVVTGHQWWWEVQYRDAISAALGHDRQRDPPPGRPAGGARAPVDRRDSQLLAAEPDRQARPDPRPGEQPLARRPTARASIAASAPSSAGTSTRRWRSWSSPSRRTASSAGWRPSAIPRPRPPTASRAARAGGVPRRRPARCVTPSRARRPAAASAPTSLTSPAAAPSPPGRCPIRAATWPAGSSIPSPSSPGAKMPSKRPDAGRSARVAGLPGDAPVSATLPERAPAAADEQSSRQLEATWRPEPGLLGLAHGA